VRKFKKGDLVKLSEAAKTTYPNEWAQYGDKIGVVALVTDDVTFPYCVRWGADNLLYSYNDRHLLPGYNVTIEDVL